MIIIMIMIMIMIMIIIIIITFIITIHVYINDCTSSLAPSNPQKRVSGSFEPAL
jgi:hypothetical protein